MLAFTAWITTWIATMMHSLFAFVIILVPLVVFHEFGHFVFAKLFGVRADIFSVGFGPRLWSRQIGETEWRLSLIPLGGYVKLLGEDRETEIPDQEQKRSLHRQAPWKRFLIFFGGPLFNFILAVFIFMVILAIGEPQIASFAGRVVRGSAAEKAGFESGDQILSVEGKSVKKFEEVGNFLNDNPGKVLDFEVVHPQSATSIHLKAKTSIQSGYSVYGEAVQVGEIEGLLPIPRATQLGISNLNSVAGKAGLLTGDKVIEVNRHPVETWEEIESIYAKVNPHSSVEFKFQKARGTQVLTLSWVKPLHSRGGDLGEDFGLYSSELFVEKPVQKSPAEIAGIRPGDRLMGVGQNEVQSFFDLKDAVQKAGEKEGTVRLRWERLGQIFTVAIKPTETPGRDALLNKVNHYTVGVMPMLVLGEPKTLVERVLNPFKLVVMAMDRVATFSWRNLISLKKMFTGDVSVGTLGGPIMIGKIAGESLSRGLVVFLTNMAIFSIGLGVLNILPVPALDGGHLMLLGVEILRGKPLTLRQMEIIQGIGLILILTLMGIAFHNDIARLIYS